MKFFVTFLLFINCLSASVYYAKVEPREHYFVKSAVTGLVVKVYENLESKFGKGSLVVKIDDSVDLSNLKSSENKLKFLKSSIEITQKSVANSKKLYQINKNIYDRIKNLSSYSKVQKDSKLSAMISAQNSYLSLKNSYENLQSNLEDLRYKIEMLKDKIEKKNIFVSKDRYIYKIYPREGDFLNFGSPILELYDLSFAKLILFVPIDELQKIKKSTIYIDGKKTDYKIHKIWRVADSKNISSYRVEILIKPPKEFSKLVKVEFR